MTALDIFQTLTEEHQQMFIFRLLEIAEREHIFQDRPDLEPKGDCK